MRLSIIIPVYNEEQTVGNVIDTLLALKLKCEKEIVVIDDGSTDGTEEEIKKRLKKNKKFIHAIFMTKNSGKGAAVKKGIDVATGEYILIQDADLEYSPTDIPSLLRPILIKGERMLGEKAVYGSRFMRPAVSMPTLYIFGNKMLTILTNLLCGLHLTDMETGYKLLPRSFLKSTSIISRHFDVEPEITVKLFHKKIPIEEVPISYKGRSHLSGKKLTVMDAIEAIRALFYFRFIAKE